MRGHRMSRRKSRRVFRGHSKVHRRNFTHHASRGGIRF